MAKKEAKTAPKKPLSNAPGAGPAIRTDAMPEGAKMYWCGTFPECPKQNETLAGVTFARVTQKVYDIPGHIKTGRQDQSGQVIPLTQDQVEAVLSAAKRKKVRWNGRRGVVVNSKNPLYKRMEGDVSIGRYMYMVALDDVVESHGAQWWLHRPEPMLKDGE